MLKIKSQLNQKLLTNFSNQSFPNITVITSTSKYHLNVAYLVIDSQYFNQLPPQQKQVNLSHLPQKQLVQVLRALYGDQLIVHSVSELELVYKVIHQLQIQQYKMSIVQEIMKSKELMENLQVLEFCFKNSLIVEQIKKFHFENNLKALESNKNFLQLNKISLNTLIPLLNEFYEHKDSQNVPVVNIINNIMQNYFNRNNIRAIEFFQQHDNVEVLLRIWEQFHHFLHIQKKPQLAQTMHISHEQKLQEMKNSMIEKPRSQTQLSLLAQKQARIAQLQSQIQLQNRLKQKLSKQFYSLKAEIGKIHSTKRPSNNPILTLDEQEQISLIQPNTNNNGKKDIVLKNIKSETTAVRTPARLGIGLKSGYMDY